MGLRELYRSVRDLPLVKTFLETGSKPPVDLGFGDLPKEEPKELVKVDIVGEPIYYFTEGELVCYYDFQVCVQPFFKDNESFEGVLRYEFRIDKTTGLRTKTTLDQKFQKDFGIWLSRSFLDEDIANFRSQDAKRKIEEIILADEVLNGFRINPYF